MITITTGRNPAPSTRRLIKELTKILPDTSRLTRGKLSLQHLASRLRATNSDRLIVIYRGFGGPKRLELIGLEENKMKKIPPTIILQGVTFTSTGSRHVREVECITVDSKEASRLGEVLSGFLGLKFNCRESGVTYSLHLSSSPEGFLRIAPTNIQTGEVGGFIMFAKELWW